MAPRKPDTLRKVSDENAALREALARCIARVEALENARETDIRRMGALQAELDHLRANTRR